MRSDALFERCWAELTDGATLEEIAARVPADVLDDLSTAQAIQQLDRGIEVPDTEVAWAAIRSQLEAIPPVVGLRRARRRPLVARAVVGVAAGLVVLVSISMRATPGSPLYPVRLGLEQTALILSPSDGDLHVRLGLARLDDLLHVLTEGPVSDAPDLARELVAERTAALADGADVARLDPLVASDVPSALAGVPPEISSPVRAILGALLPPPPTGSSEESVEAGTPGAPAGSSSGGSEGGEESGAIQDDESEGAGDADSDEAPAQEGSDQRAGDEDSRDTDGGTGGSGGTAPGDEDDSSPSEQSPDDEASPDISE